jgi:hypothetical protein
MSTTININISGYGVSQTTEPSPDPYRVYPLLPGFSPVRELYGERKIKAKKKKNCSQGQVCGFSCVSKTKTCTADMTTAQLKEHNAAKRLAAAEKRKAAKGGGAVGANNPIINQAAGGNTLTNSLIDIVSMKIGDHDKEKADVLKDGFLTGAGPIRPVIVKPTGDPFDPDYEVIGRQNEAAAMELARQTNKSFSLAPTIILNKKNEDAVNEQIQLTSSIKREIPVSNAPPSKPFDPKNPKIAAGLFDIVSIQDSTNFGANEQKQIEALAQNYLKIGNVDPILIKVKGVNKETFDNDYEVFSGKFEFAALKRAKEINPSFELAKALVVDDSNERSVVNQLSAIYGD